MDADRPHRFVSKENWGRFLLVVKTIESSAGLSFNNGPRPATLPFGERLADANKRDQAVTHSGFGFEAHRLVRLTEMFAALRVAQPDEIEATILQHWGRDFPSPSAVSGPMHILSADLDGRVAQDRLHLSRHRKRGNDEALNTVVAGAISSR